MTVVTLLGLAEANHEQLENLHHKYWQADSNIPRL